MSKPKTKDDSDTKASSQQANPQQAPSLLSESSVAMFDQLGASNGGTMKRKIFGMFSHHATQALSALRQAVEQKAPYNEIGNLAHALKSMCASSGAQAAQIAAQRLEDMAHERAVIQICDLDALAELVAQTDHAMQAVLVQETATQPNTASQA